MAGLRYSLQVTAINIAGESLAAIGYITVGNIPSPPYGLSLVSVVPSNNLVISWKGPTTSGGLPLLNYVINKNGADLTTTILASATQYTDDITSGGTIGSSFTYKIKAINAAGSSSYSDQLNVQIGILPNPPQNLALISHPSNSSVTLGWSQETAVTSNYPTLGYRIYIQGTTNLLFDCTKSSIVLQTTLQNLITGNTYNLVARSVNTLGESSDSNQLSAVVGLPPGKMLPPTLNASSSTSITIGWVSPTSNGGLPVTGYNVYMDIGQTGTFTLLKQSDPTVMTYIRTSLTTGVKVDWKISAFNTVGEGLLSDISTFIAATVPSTPSAPTILSAYSPNGTSINLEIQWQPPPNGGTSITGYQLYSCRSDAPNFTLIFDGTNRPDITSYVSQGLTIGNSYKFQVQAINSVGISAVSSTLVALAATKPTQPINVYVLSSTSGSVTISWQPPTFSGGLLISSYTIYYSLDALPYNWLTVTGISSALSQYTISTLAIDNAYAFKVTAVNSLGEGPFSATISQYASNVPSGLSTLSITASSRTMNSIGLSWTAPTSTIPVKITFYILDNWIHCIYG